MPPSSRSGWIDALRGIVAAALAGTLLTAFALDWWAKRSVPYFESAFSAAMQRPVSIQSAGYSLLHGLHFEHFSLKEKKTAPRPLSIKRLEAHTAIRLWPEPTVRIHKLVLVEPRIGIDVHPEDLFRSQLWLKRVPYLETRIGRLKLLAQLDSVEARNANVSLFSPNGVRQDFDAVQFFAGKRWRSPQALLFEGRVKNNPKARFKIDCFVRPGISGEHTSETRAKFQHFTSAYLAPFLADRIALPDRSLTASLHISVDSKGEVNTMGRLALPQPPQKSWNIWQARPYEIRFKLSGRRELDRLIFDDFTVRTSGVTVTGGASVVWKKGQENWNAWLAANKVPAEKLPKVWSRPWNFTSGTLDFKLKVEGDSRAYRSDARFQLTDVHVENKQAAISIDRATGGVRIQRGRAELLNLWMFWNGTPVRASGLVLFGENGRLAIEGQTYPGQFESLKKKNPVNTSFRLAAKNSVNGWSGALRTHLEIGAKDAATWTVSFRGWQIRRFVKNRVDLNVRRLLIRSDLPPGSLFAGPLRLQDLAASTSGSPSQLYITVARARADGGKLAGHFSWKNASGARAWMMLRGVDAQKLARRLGLRHPVTGRLDGALSWRSGKSPLTTGHFRVRGGQIGPSPSFQKLSDDTGIESLRAIRFEKFSGRFRAAKKILILERWELDGKDLHLSAQARIREGVMSGQLTARFPLSVVRKSSSLAWLANFVGEHREIDFDFRIAGKVQRPRAHWMAGTFREKIQRRLAPWMQAEFNRQIQKRFAEKPAVAAA